MRDLGYFSAFEVSDFHSADRSRQYLLTLGQKHFEINYSVFNLISLIKRFQDLNKVALEFSLLANRRYTADDIERLICKLIDPIWDNREVITYSKSFIFKRNIISHGQLRHVTGVFSKLFNSACMLLLGAAAVTGILYAFFFQNNQPAFSPGLMYKLPLVLLLYFVSIVFHELGHVSACRYYNITHGSIGIAVYIYSPVFYADVTNCWRLKRQERMKVNLGGMYFQLLYALLMVLLAPWLGWNIVLPVITFILWSFVINLNPFFKLDGYWIVSDLLGIANLGRLSHNAFKVLVLRLLGKDSRKYEADLSRIPAANRRILCGYILLSNIFFSYVFLYSLPVMCYRYFSLYLNQLDAFYLNVSGWYLHNAEFSNTEFREFLLRSVYAALLLVVIINLLKRFYRSVKGLSAVIFN